MRHPFRPRSRAAALLGLALVVALGVSLVHYFFPQPPRTALPAELALRPDDVVLVLAPHSDDETLGAGGLIERAGGEGAQVYVALITNGDGFTLAATEASHRLPRPQDYITLAYERQQESLAALQRLGVPASHVTFLGYPDRGIAHLWLDNWSARNSYLTPFTRTDRSPYRNSYHPSAPYAGEVLEADLRQLLSQIQPTVLVLPHPNDAHPDHWATYNFATLALEELRDGGAPFALSLRQYLYLVHRGDWPAPKGLRPGAALLPPAPLLRTGTHWFRLDLDPQGIQAKYEAIRFYPSQHQLMPRYLDSFARRNEVFGTLAPRELPLIPASAGSSSPPNWGAIPWSSLPVLIQDPMADTLTRELEGSADLIEMRAATDGGSLYIRLVTRKPASPHARYRICLHPIGGGVRSAGLCLQVEPGRRPGEFAVAGNTILARLPLSLLGHPDKVLISADSRLYTNVDQLAWTLALLPVPKAAAAAR